MSVSPISVPLPHRPRDLASNNTTPVWPLVESSEHNHPSVPLPAKCDRFERDGGVCCKDLKGDDERTLIDPDIVRDA